MIKRFIVESTREYRKTRRKKPEITSDKSVAVIGSGPSGLTAAMDLALLGFRVKVYEKDTKLGGMLAHAIPRYRLPVQALAEDIEDIVATGVEVHSDCCVGVDISFEQLKEENDAVLIAVGLSRAIPSPFRGPGARGYSWASPFFGMSQTGYTPILERAHW